VSSITKILLFATTDYSTRNLCLDGWLPIVFKNFSTISKIYVDWERVLSNINFLNTSIV